MHRAFYTLAFCAPTPRMKRASRIPRASPPLAVPSLLPLCGSAPSQTRHPLILVNRAPARHLAGLLISLFFCFLLPNGLVIVSPFPAPSSPKPSCREQQGWRLSVWLCRHRRKLNVRLSRTFPDNYTWHSRSPTIPARGDSEALWALLSWRRITP